MMSQPDHDTTCAVLLTPAGRAAIASILIAGPRAVPCVGRYFRASNGRCLEEQSRDRPLFGHWGTEAGEEVVVWVRQPDEIEVHCHGGHAVVEWILESVEAGGARRRSFEDWVVDEEPTLIRAAARIALAEVVTTRTAGVLLDQYAGCLEEELKRLARLLSGTEDPATDEPSEPRMAALEGMDRLLQRAPLGLHLTQPWSVVLGGRANVGKSTLINALVGYERALVSHTPGTTRDVVTASTALDGWPVLLADTAGFREPTGEVEAAGIRQAFEAFREADLRILVFDRRRPLSGEDRHLISQWPDAMLVANKVDLPDRTDGALPSRALPVSAKTGAGIDSLAAALGRALVSSTPVPGTPVPFRIDQIERLREAHELLAAGEVNRAKSILEGLLASNRNKPSSTVGNS